MSEIKDIGGTIKWLRIQRGFTQEQLGDKMGFDKSTISRLERDATPYKLGTAPQPVKPYKASINGQDMV